MKIGIITDSLQDMPFTEALDWVAAQGIQAVEIGTGNFSHGKHCDLEKLVNEAGAREEFLVAIESRGLILSALNCNGNLLDPHLERGKRSQDVFHKTVEAASKLGLDTVVTMSGCPGEPGGCEYPNWVLHPWQKEYLDLYEWQWDQVIEPFWKQAGRFASDRGVKIAIEMHPGQSVYNTSTLLRLREIAGPSLGANLDPSHLFYQGMDPMVVIRTLGQDFIFHVHAKDTKINSRETAVNGAFDLRPMSMVAERSWTYRTLGFGHGADWWSDFLSELRLVGYDGVLSIEHEDPVMSSKEGIVKSVEFLKPLVIETMPEENLPWL